jgi:LPXTG-motif cell wall-anchored protein
VNVNQTDPSARRSLRRLLALTGGLAIGITAILALAVPASATGDHGKGGHKSPKPTCSPSASKSPSESPSPSPTKSESASPSASPSAPEESPSATPSPVPGAGGGGEELPVTGASIGTAAGIGAVLLAAGAGLFLALRRRRIRFTA